MRNTLVGLVLLGTLAGCASRSGDDVVAPGASASQAARRCVVDIPAGVTGLVAFDGGVALAVSDGTNETVERYRGDACALVRDRSAAIASGGLLDADDRGNAYVFPAESKRDGVIGTMLADEYSGSMVAKVDGEGRVSKLLPAGRGIWSFGVSPGGGALWVSACGPTGIFAIASDTATWPMPQAMSPPETLWEQRPSVLTTDRTFFSVGVRTCGPTEPMTTACGFALVRTTPEGSRAVGSTLRDFGRGVEEATLARCGRNVCGVFATAILVWDDEGRAVQTIALADVAATPGERIARASGNAHGTYVLLRDGTAARVVFVSAPG